MKQEEEKAIGVPENAFRELKPGEVYKPVGGAVGYRHGGTVFGSGSLSGAESGTGIRSRHPHRHYRRRRVRRSQA